MPGRIFNCKGEMAVFNLFGKKNKGSVILYAPVKGKVIELEKVPDDVFAQKMLGDGVAVEPADTDVVAPCDGKVLLVSQTRHAVAIQTKDGLEVLIHVGLDTVELAGEGFVTYVKAGDNVKKGDKLITFDRDFLETKGKSAVTPMVITNMDDKVKNIQKKFPTDGGEVMEVTLK